MRNTKLKTFSRILFVFYIISALYFMLFSEAMGRNIHSETYRYNLVLFKEINRYISNAETLGFWAVFLNLIGNVICFIPFGIILPMASRRFRKLYRVIFLMLGFSLFVELMQLVFKIGAFDVDDLLLNVVGAFIGYIIYFFGNVKMNSRGRKKSEKKKNKTR